MATQPIDYSPPPQRSSNLGPVERVASIVGGLALVARGAMAYCPAKAALADSARDARLGERLRKRARTLTSEAANIDTMAELYVAELQELRSGVLQLEELLSMVIHVGSDHEFTDCVDDYAQELPEQRRQIEEMLKSREADPRKHPDDAMTALVKEASKMMKIGGSPSLRDAALIGSLQRIIHYRIAAFGTVASYAKTLRRNDEAESLATFADNEKAVDAALTGLAKTAANPSASTVS